MSPRYGEVRCDLCGDFTRFPIRARNGYEICYDCLSSLIENEAERRGVRAQERAMEDGWSGDDRLRQDMAEARKLK